MRAGTASMYGTFDRMNYDVTIQTRGTLHTSAPLRQDARCAQTEADWTAMPA